MPDQPFTPGAVSYSGRTPAGYRTARALSPEAEATWRGVIDRWLGPLRPKLVADIGSGTGRFSALLAETLDAHILAVERSPEMRAQAGPHPRVSLVAADAQALPLRSASCDAAWMAYVIHHVPDRAACAREIARVLRPGGRLLIVGAFAGRADGLTLLRFFPEARRILDAYPAVEETVATFTAAGLAFETLEPVRLHTCDSLAEAAARTRLRADTTLELLTDEEFTRGQAAIEAAAAAETAPTPIHDAIDLLVFQRA